MIARILGGLLLVVALAAAAYLKGRTDGSAASRATLEAERAVHAQAMAAAVESKVAIETERNAALREIADELLPALVAARSDRSDLTGRLFAAIQAGARRCPVPGDPAPAGGDSGTVALADGLAELRRDVDAARAAGTIADAKHAACVAAYERVRTAGD